MKDTPFSSFEEVWEALNRLYLSTEQLKESARLVVESQVGNVKQLNELTVAMTELARVQLDHAKRLERLEGGQTQQQRAAGCSLHHAALTRKPV